MYKVFSNAKIQAFEPPIVRWPDGFRGGLVIEDDDLTPLRHTRRGRAVDSFRSDAKFEKILSGEYVYGGPVQNHFGHFMSEMIHRIIPARRLHPPYPFIFVGTSMADNLVNYDSFPNHIRDILSFLSITGKNLQVVTENTIVEKLHVFEAGSDLGGGPKSDYTDMLRDYSQERLDHTHPDIRRPKKLYVSRSALEPQGVILGERYLEIQLEREGFTIFRPEEYRFSPQLDHYRKADIIIFPEGSACHGTELLGTGMMNNTFLLPRRDAGEGSEALALASVLSSRSKKCDVMFGCVQYLGTAAAHPRTGARLPHCGVSWLNIKATAQFCQRNEIANLETMNSSEYEAVAVEDFERYLTFQRRFASTWNECFAQEAAAAFKTFRGRCS